MYLPTGITALYRCSKLCIFYNFLCANGSNHCFFLFSERLHWSIWPSVLACVVGGYFLSDISDVNVRFGDSLVLIGAVFWALHIIYIGKIIKQFDLPFFIALLQNLIELKVNGPI